jgi:secondary thiamine-phosphate synthase enzyme
MPHARFTVSTSRSHEVIDITKQVQQAVSEMGVEQGIACISVSHCTCALYLDEFERGLVADTLRLLEELTGREGWQHDRIDDNAAAHLASTLLGASLTLPVVDRTVELGTWQRILLAELDGPRRRNVTVSVVADE